MLITINLREFYPFYTTDEFVEVTVEVAEELKADKRYQVTHERKMRHNKVLSLDVPDGTEEVASIRVSDNPAVLLDVLERHCSLCSAINSLPEIQGRRIEAYYLKGKSQLEIAKNECVVVSSVNESIKRGLKTMKKIIQNNSGSCPKI